MELFSELPDKSIVTLLWRWTFWGTQICPNLLSDWQTASFYSYQSCKAFSFRCCSRTWEGNGIRSNWNATRFTLLTKLQPFFLNKQSLGCCMPLVNFQGFENGDFWQFFSCYYCFYAEGIFGGHYSTILNIELCF